MNNLLELSVPTTDVPTDSNFRGTFSTLPHIEYMTGLFLIQTDHSPVELERVIASQVGSANVRVWRVTADTIQDAVLPPNARAWLAKAFPTLKIVDAA